MNVGITKVDAQEVLRHKYGVERARLDAPPDGVYAKPLVPAPTAPRGLRAPRAAGVHLARSSPEASSQTPTDAVHGDA